VEPTKEIKRVKGDGGGRGGYYNLKTSISFTIIYAFFSHFQSEASINI
jgi:hypothetical protein